MIMRILVAVNGDLLSFSDHEQFFTTSQKKALDIINSLGELICNNEVMITFSDETWISSLLRTHERGYFVGEQLDLDIGIAYVEGVLGYMLQQNLSNWLLQHDMHKNVVTLVTRVLVEADDSGLSHDSEGIGPFYDLERAQVLQQTRNWQMRLVPGRGYQRVVEVLESCKILEVETVLRVLDENSVVICAGGGGIPVRREKDGSFSRVMNALANEASSTILLAENIKADLIVFVEPMRALYDNFPLAHEGGMYRMNLECLERMIAEGEVKSALRRRLVANKKYLENWGATTVYLAPKQVPKLFNAETGVCICDDADTCC
jgi:carbamate kinase